MSESCKVADIRTVLSCITGRLLTVPTEDGNGIYDLYALIDHGLNTEVSTLSLAKASDTLALKVLELYPELKIAMEKIKRLDEFLTCYPTDAEFAIQSWVKSLNLKDEYLIPVFPEGVDRG